MVLICGEWHSHNMLPNAKNRRKGSKNLQLCGAKPYKQMYCKDQILLRRRQGSVFICFFPVVQKLFNYFHPTMGISPYSMGFLQRV